MKKLLLFFGLIIIFSCREKGFEDDLVSISNLSKEVQSVNIDYRGQKLVAFKDEHGNYLIGDDIMLYKNDVKELGMFSKLNRVSEWDKTEHININLWPNKEISYKIGNGFSAPQKALIYQALKHWSDNTIIKFKAVGSNENVNFKKVNSGCRANLGFLGLGLVNTVELSDTCDLQSIIHEIGHVVGLIHEHQRESRDNYISLQPTTFDYIKNNYSSLYSIVIKNLQKESSDLDDPFPFDVNSVMMYGSYPRNAVALRSDLIAKNMPLYKKNDGSLVSRPTSGLTNKDIDLVNHYYSRKLTLKNIDYNVIHVKIRLEGARDPATVLFNQGDEITLKFDESKRQYTYNGHVVQQLDLNNGSSSDDLTFSWGNSNNIVYSTNDGDHKILIANYNDLPNSHYYHFTDSDGIDGGSKNAIIEAIKKDDYQTYINLKSWKSTINTDGKLHTFNKRALYEVIIRNIDYTTLERVKMRLTDCSDQIISLKAGESIVFQYSINHFQYNGCRLQQIDFNNHAASDDLNFEWSSALGEVTYKASHNYTTTLMDINNGYIYGTVDTDGIDGNNSNAQLDGNVSGGKIYIDIKK